MYSREPRKSTNSASDASHQNQFASKPFIIPQPRFDTEQPESEQTPDSQTEQGQAKPQGTWTNASMFTHRPVPKPPKIQLKRNQLPVVQNVTDTKIQRLPVKINQKLVDVEKTDIADEEKIKALLHRLGLDNSESTSPQNSLAGNTQELLQRLVVKLDENSINKQVFLNVINKLIQGQPPDWSAWDDLERYQQAVQPIIDERDDIKANDKRDKSTYFQWYYQNLKDKGMDYENLVNTFVDKNEYGMGIAEAQAIFGYTSVLFYTKMNELLRKGVNEDKTTLLKVLLENALKKLPISKSESGKHYRGMNIEPGVELDSFLEKYKKGKRVKDNQFNSAAKYPVQPFWDEANIRFTILSSQSRDVTELAFGTHFIEILTKDSKKPRQNDTHESLFLPNAEFLVNDITTQNEPRTKKDEKIQKESTEVVTVYNIILEQINTDS